MTLFLVRHGSAGLRRDGDPSDTERHLDELGEQQAAAIAAALGSTTPPVERIISSRAARCQETVGPLAVVSGLPVELDDALFEGADLDRSWKLAESLASGGVSAILCSHGDVIPELIRRARMRGTDTTGAGCKKGSIWALHWDGERFARAKYTPVPG